MAIVGYLRWRDWLNNVSAQKVTFQDHVTDVSVAMALLTDLAIEIKSVSAAALDGMTITTVGDLAGIVGNVTTNASNNSERAQLVMQLATPGKTGIFNVIAPLPTLFTAGSGQLIPATVAEVAGVLSGSFAISDGELINAAVGVSGCIGGHWSSVARSSR